MFLVKLGKHEHKFQIHRINGLRDMAFFLKLRIFDEIILSILFEHDRDFKWENDQLETY